MKKSNKYGFSGMGIGAIGVGFLILAVNTFTLLPTLITLLLLPLSWKLVSKADMERDKEQEYFEKVGQYQL